MAVQNFDELNVLGGLSKDSASKKRKILDYKTFFGEMELNRIQKEERIALAEDIELAMLFLFELVSKSEEFRVVNKDDIKIQFEEELQSAITKNVDVDDYIKGYVSEIADSLVETTLNNFEGHTDDSDDNWWVSDDRAVSVAENEASTICNYNDYQDAINNGYNAKQWITMKDERVRDTHWMIDGEIKPIGEPFEVGAYLMQYPRDISYGAGLEEIVNCRCSIKYLKK